MDLGLAGRRALITGGTKGIGRAIAECLVDEGVNISICSRNQTEVFAAIEKLSRNGIKAIGRALDVGDAKALQSWVAESAAALGGIDIIISNVSALAISGPDAWQESFKIDMMGTVQFVDAAMPFIEKSDTASIVVISSVSGREVDFAAGPYGSFKAALIHYSQGLAFHLAHKNIRVNSVSPGNTYFPGGVWEKIEQTNPKLFAEALALNPTGRMAKPDEVARAVTFLASPAASFITGTNLLVDGALTRGVQF